VATHTNHSGGVGPEGCAACSAKDYPQNSYRNGPLYGTYTVEVLTNALAGAHQKNINFLGAVTWAFEFEEQPYFAGFRKLATNGVDKPVLKAFRMLGFLGKDRVQVTSSAALPREEIVRAGVRGQPDINAIATRKDREIEVLVWNYHDDDVPFPAAPSIWLSPACQQTLNEAFSSTSGSIPTTATHSRRGSRWAHRNRPARVNTIACKALVNSSC
jgi:hypothetical protein